MNQLDTSGRLERDMAALQKATGISATVDDFLVALVLLVAGPGGIAAVFAGGLVGVILLVASVLLGVVAYVTKLGEGIMIGVVALLSIGAGVASVLAAVLSATS